MSNIDFKPGDLVRLKSGGPEMTIEEIAEYHWNGRNQAMCKWFENGALQQQTFELTSLQRVSE